jgi:hypothetical protein
LRPEEEEEEEAFTLYLDAAFFSPNGRKLFCSMKSTHLPWLNGLTQSK